MTPEREKHRSMLRAKLDALCGRPPAGVGADIWIEATSMFEALDAIAGHIRTSSEPPPPRRNGITRGDQLRADAAAADAYDNAVRLVREVVKRMRSPQVAE